MSLMVGDLKYSTKVTQNKVTRLTGWFTVGAASAISAQATDSTATSGGQQCGVSWAKNAVGDFRPTFHRGYKRLIRFSCSIVLPAVGTAPLINEATVVLPIAAAGHFSGATPVPAAGTGLGISAIFAGAATPLVANPTNGATITFDIELSDL